MGTHIYVYIGTKPHIYILENIQLVLIDESILKIEYNVKLLLSSRKGLSFNNFLKFLVS